MANWIFPFINKILLIYYIFSLQLFIIFIKSDFSLLLTFKFKEATVSFWEKNKSPADLAQNKGLEWICLDTNETSLHKGDLHNRSLIKQEFETSEAGLCDIHSLYLMIQVLLDVLI